MGFGSRINKLRKSKNITQAELAKYLFVTDKTISSWESNRTEPNLELLVKLSEVLECSVSYLFFGDIEKNNIETEIKIKITENEYKYLDNFMKNNAKYLNESLHHDIYFQTKENTNEFLRIGERGNKKILTYKNMHNNFYCDEYEVEIDDSKNLEKIFYALGIDKLTEVDKIRKSYFYLDKYKISLDNVRELGFFIEIEIKKISNNYEKDINDLLLIAKSLDLNLSNMQKKRYAMQMIEKQN